MHLLEKFYLSFFCTLAFLLLLGACLSDSVLTRPEEVFLVSYLLATVRVFVKEFKAARNKGVNNNWR
ncbi:hypothetical protein [Tellurirhabdus bombi]|uniref:hypothetical protein n=1 Tax=Tellurirhabdus bombi TaxID=2907205 RepID=UPI001F43D95F|nr:hypothetical protein [Tellurirhabdus bombi]